MAQAIKENNYQESFKHRTTIREDGTILYDMPILIEHDDELQYYGITQADCITLKLGSSDSKRVWFCQTENRELAEYQWTYISTIHMQEFLSLRCIVPGKKKDFIRCPLNMKCSQCPWGIKPENKQSRTISWDRLIEAGYEPTTGIPVEKQVIDKIEMEEFERIMEAEDPRIWTAFALKRFEYESAKTISMELKISVPRVYQLLERANEIIRENREAEY